MKYFHPFGSCSLPSLLRAVWLSDLRLRRKSGGVLIIWGAWTGSANLWHPIWNCCLLTEFLTFAFLDTSPFDTLNYELGTTSTAAHVAGIDGVQSDGLTLQPSAALQRGLGTQTHVACLVWNLVSSWCMSWISEYFLKGEKQHGQTRSINSPSSHSWDLKVPTTGFFRDPYGETFFIKEWKWKGMTF